MSAGRLRRLRVLTRKEFQQLRRDPILLILIGWLFTVEVILCAYALSFDLRDAPVAIVDLDGTPASRELTGRIDRSGEFRIAARRVEAAEAGRVLDRDAALAVVTIPSGWSRARLRGEDPAVGLVVDGSNSASASAVRSYLLGLLAAPPETALPGGYGAAVESRTRVWYNPNLETVYFMVLSMIALGGLLVGVVHPAAFLVKEREEGTIEQLAVSPASAWEVVGAKSMATFATGMAGFGVALGLVAWFDLPIRGDLLLYGLAAAIFLASAIGLGVLLATWARDLRQALLLSFFGLIPVMFLSGTMVPLENMPAPIRVTAQASPLTHFVEILLGVFLKGQGLATLGPHLAVMALLGGTLYAAGLFRFRRLR